MLSWAMCKKKVPQKQPCVTGTVQVPGNFTRVQNERSTLYLVPGTRYLYVQYSTLYTTTCRRDIRSHVRHDALAHREACDKTYFDQGKLSGTLLYA